MIFQELPGKRGFFMMRIWKYWLYEELFYSAMTYPVLRLLNMIYNLSCNIFKMFWKLIFLKLILFLELKSIKRKQYSTNNVKLISL